MIWIVIYECCLLDYFFDFVDVFCFVGIFFWLFVGVWGGVVGVGCVCVVGMV